MLNPDIRNLVNSTASALDVAPVYSSNLMSLGMFVFERGSLPYQELQRQAGWRHPSGTRVGARPVSQFAGPDEETITLSGVLLPELTGGTSAIDTLRAMADEGGAWPLIEGNGTIYGQFVIEKIDEGRSLFFHDGAARRIEFTIGLKRSEPDEPVSGQP
ncbi:phage tail protein [Silvimonas sp.]|uniref:phage tail protein n=1 Tax=Silvimonas sp. TaxID=2650811 RepID=UPI00284211C3|nr:phage tail protein [Silvimonas sp.]MDR3429696.1 phage tail protein [Silvimonas sp.]